MASRHNIMMRNLIDSQALCVEVKLLHRFNSHVYWRSHFYVQIVQVLDAGLARLAQKSEVAQLLGIFDLRNLSPFNVDIEFILFLIEIVYK